MPTILNSNQEQESAMIMSAIKRYFGGNPQSPGATGPDSILLEALNAYFKDRNGA